MVVRKLSTLGAMGTTGDPDRLFAMNGKILLMEMKRPGGKCTMRQLISHEEWTRAGIQVVVVDDVKAGRDVLTAMYGAPTATR